MSTLTVEEILDTYDLDPKTRAVVERTVKPTLASFGYTNCFALYRGIANLLERIRELPEERSSLRVTPGYAISEDRVAGSTSKKDDLKGLGNLDQNEAIDLLGRLHGKMKGEELEEIARTLGINLSPARTDIEKIRLKIEGFLQLFSYKGRVVIPNRPLVSVSLNPIKVRYKRRDYLQGGLAFFRENQDRYAGLTRADLNRVDAGLARKLRVEGTLSEAIPDLARREYPTGPLAFFRENQDRYAGLTRTGLSKKDNALYQALVKSGQINLAIPRVLTPREVSGLPEEEVRRVVGLFKKFGSATEVSKQTGHRPGTIAKYAREAGLKVRKWGDSPNHISDDKRSQIIQEIQTTHDTNYRIAKRLGVAKETVKRIRTKLTNPAT